MLRNVIRKSMGEIKERIKHIFYWRAFITKKTQMKQKITFRKQNVFLL